MGIDPESLKLVQVMERFRTDVATKSAVEPMPEWMQQLDREFDESGIDVLLGLSNALGYEISRQGVVIEDVYNVIPIGPDGKPTSQEGFMTVDIRYKKEVPAQDGAVTVVETRDQYFINSKSDEGLSARTRTLLGLLAVQEAPRKEHWFVMPPRHTQPEAADD